VYYLFDMLFRHMTLCRKAISLALSHYGSCVFSASWPPWPTRANCAHSLTHFTYIGCSARSMHYQTKQGLMNRPVVSPHNFQSTWGVYHGNEWPVCKIWSSEHGVDESNQLRSSAITTRKWLPTIWRNTLPKQFTD